MEHYIEREVLQNMLSIEQWGAWITWTKNNPGCFDEFGRAAEGQVNAFLTAYKDTHASAS